MLIMLDTGIVSVYNGRPYGCNGNYANAVGDQT